MPEQNQTPPTETPAAAPATRTVVRRTIEQIMEPATRPMPTTLAEAEQNYGDCLANRKSVEANFNSLVEQATAAKARVQQFADRQSACLAIIAKGGK